MTNGIRFVLDRALNGVETLPAAQRAVLYDGVAEIAKGDTAEQAKKMAFANRELARQERKLATQQTEFLVQLFS